MSDCPFSRNRKAECPQANNRPAIVIDDNFCVWVGNLLDAELKLQPTELFGFGKGSYEEKQVGRCLRFAVVPTLLLLSHETNSLG